MISEIMRIEIFDDKKESASHPLSSFIRGGLQGYIAIDLGREAWIFEGPLIERGAKHSPLC